MKEKLDARHVADAATGRWGEICMSLAPQTEPAIARIGRHVACPMHGGKDGFRVFPDFDKTGGGCCNTCGAYKDGFALLQALNGWDFRSTLESVACHLGLSKSGSRRPVHRPVNTPPPQYGPDPIQLQEKLRRVWNASFDLSARESEPARLYLRNRGKLLDAFDCIETVRCHPNLAAWEIDDDDKPVRIGSFPAIVSAVQDPSGRFVSIHRTYITEDGRKAPIDKTKKLMMSPYGRGALVGGAIPIGKPGSIMGVAEGIETAAAVTIATGMVVWPCISAQLLESFEPPEHVRDIVIWADKDRNGRGLAAGHALKERMWKTNRRCAVVVPDMPIPTFEKSIDWNDVWVHGGTDGFPLSSKMRQHSTVKNAAA